MKLNLTANTEKSEVFKVVKQYLEENNFKIITVDQGRPWGGFFVIDETQKHEFINLFFKNIAKENFETLWKMSPKILIIEPQKRLSWQYHLRRSEVWKVINGNIKVATSLTNEEKEPTLKTEGDLIVLKQEERHRIVGTDQWGIVAEIWQHSNSLNPSNEEDIIRVQDDFGR